MGYSTTFEGRFELDKSLKPEHLAYLKAFHDTRHMKWRTEIIEEIPNPIREAVGLPLGEDGGYFVAFPIGSSEWVTDYNHAPKGQPSLWCQWIPSEDGKYIQWDGDEKFYHFVGWLVYLIHHFLEPWGYILNGVTSWQGEEIDDYGTIVVKDNVIDDLLDLP